MKLLCFSCRNKIMANTSLKVDVVVITLFLFVVLASVWQGQYNIDPHHWGLMFSTALELLHGGEPYKDVFVQYGIITTSIHAISLVFFGDRLLSIIIITAVFYALGLVYLYYISRFVIGRRDISVYVVATCIAIHPVAMYPWPNYISFFFITSGIYYLLKNDESVIKLLISGSLLSLSVLAREELFGVFILLIFVFFILDFFYSKGIKKKILVCYLYLVLGFIFPLAAFFVFLYSNDLLPSWYNVAIAYRASLIESKFSAVLGFDIFDALFSAFADDDPRWKVFSIIFHVDIILLITYIFYKPIGKSNVIAKLSIVSLLLYTSALHLAEIFRLSTGAVLGIVPLYRYMLFIPKYVSFGIVFFLILWLIPGMVTMPGNYFYPSAQVRQDSSLVTQPEVFRGQKWDSENISFYQRIKEGLSSVESLYDVNCYYNYTYDAFLSALTQLKRCQIMPFYNTTKDKLALKKGVVLIKEYPPMDSKDVFVPYGYMIYGKYKVPKKGRFPFYFYRSNTFFYVMVPVIDIDKKSDLL